MNQWTKRCNVTKSTKAGEGSSNSDWDQDPDTASDEKVCETPER